jgi:hypothetical protein
VATKRKVKPKKEKQPQCQIKDMIYCRGTNVRQYAGLKKGDPKFYACWTCAIKLQGLGIKFKEV